MLDKREQEFRELRRFVSKSFGFHVDVSLNVKNAWLFYDFFVEIFKEKALKILTISAQATRHKLI